MAAKLCKMRGIKHHRMNLVEKCVALGANVSEIDECWVWLTARYSEIMGHPPRENQRQRGGKSHAPNRAGIKVTPPTFTSFYKSDEWRQARFAALRAHDGRCVLCGRSHREHGVILHVDHIKPRSKFPKLALTVSNLQVLCADCNLGKGNRDDTDWGIGRSLT